MTTQQLYEANFSSIFRYFYYKDLSKEEAEDLTQETFLRFYRGYAVQDRSETECRKILFGIAKNLLKGWFTEQSHRSSIELRDDFPIPLEPNILNSDQAEECLEEQLPLLKEAIAKLNPTLRTVITLRFVEGMTRQEVAQKLGTKEKYVHIYQQRAIKALRKIVGSSVSPRACK
ncbi:RNA polymerase sigma factor [Patescibacteria group bacterium]|nr:RNA polymerase sigma factor [Patescibacteria group bacterium]